MRRTMLPVVIVAVLCQGCHKKENRADAPLTEGVPAAVTKPGAHEDRGPTLERKTGELSATVRPPGQAVVDRIERRGDHVLAVVPFPASVLPGDVDRASFVIEADGVHLSAFGWSGAAAPDASNGQAGIIVRGRELPAKFTVRWWEVAASTWGPERHAGSTGTIEVSVPARPALVKGLDEAFWSSAARWFAAHPQRGGGRDGFWGYARSRASFLAGGPEARKPPPEGWQRGSDVLQLMELYSGITSVNEALQADRGLRFRAADRDAYTVPIAEVKRLELTAHPWARLIGELGTRPKIEPLAAYVPADMAYLHFGDLRTFVKLVAEVDDWASPVAQWLEQRGGASHFVSRYEEQLILERSGLAEKLGHVAASGVAIVASDPYLREGTDVSMLFRVKNRAVLSAALAAFETSSRAQHGALQTTTSKIGAVDVTHRFSADGAVNQYRAEYGDVLVLSNSEAAMRHLISAHSGAVPRLADAGDFQYLRAVYPFDTAAEDGFVFISDAFVSRAVSPEVKILEARRMDARADLFALNYAALLRGWVDGVRSSSAKELVASGYVQPGEIQHADHTPITLAVAGGARSAWGTVARLTPIREMSITKVSQRESAAYEQFRTSYESYWRAYIDPIAARIKRSSDGQRVEIDARMMPLIDASEYDSIIETVGIQKIVGPQAAPGVEMTLAIGKDARLRHELDGVARSFIGGDAIGLGWLGDWVTVGVADRSGLWDMALRTRLIPSLESVEDTTWATIEQLATFPIYAAAHVTNPVALAAVLAGLKKWVYDAAPGMVTWGQSEPYRDVPIVTIAPSSLAAGELSSLSVHYATVENVLVVAVDRATLLTQIDRYLAGGAAKAPTGPPSGTADDDAQARLNVELTPAGWLARTAMGVAEHAMIGGHQQTMHGYEILWRGTGSGDLRAPDVRALGVAYLGYEPRSPHGGTFSLVEGYPSHSIYGDSVRPKMPDVPIADSPITRVLSELARASMSIEFDGEGDHRGLHSVVSWEWR